MIAVVVDARVLEFLAVRKLVHHLHENTASFYIYICKGRDGGGLRMRKSGIPYSFVRDSAFICLHFRIPSIPLCMIDTFILEESLMNL